MPPLPRGNPTQVVELIEDPSKKQNNRFLKLHSQVLHSITSSAGHHPIAVIVIAGAARGGKSFILSYLMRHLRALEKSTTGDAGDWMEKDDPTKSMKDQGFSFQNGTDRTTDGIWMWSRPFLIKRSRSTETVAVIIVDTEGCFDPCSTEREQSAIVGLGLLASSCFIFNETSKINENTLITLSKFMQYGQLASQSFQGKAFQRLMFLVRDWCMPDSYEYGAGGGQAFMKKAMKPTASMAEESVKCRENILKFFQDSDAYLMPHPGERVLSNDFTGSVEEMNPKFQFHVEKFIENLVADVSPKTVGGSVVTGSEFFKLFAGYVDAFNDSDLPSPASVLKTMILIAFEAERNKQVGRYKEAMESELSKRESPFLEAEVMEKLHQKALLKIREKTTLSKELGTEEERAAFQEKLHQDIHASYKAYVDQNDSKQTEYVSVCEQDALQRFQTFISEHFISSQKYWNEQEFEEIMVLRQKEAEGTFLKAATSCPENLRKKLMQSFLEKLNDVKAKVWQGLEAERKSGEGQMEGIITEITADYFDKLTLLNEDRLLGEKILVRMNDKYRDTAIKKFVRTVREKFTDENFIQEYRKKLELEICQKFEEVKTENDEKLKTFLDEMESVVKEAEDLLREELEEASPGINSSNYSSLDRLHDDVFDVSAENLEDLRVLDPEIFRTYLQKLKTSLEVVLSEAKQSIKLQEAAEEERHEAELNACQTQYSTKLQFILEQPGEFFDENELQSTLQSIQGDIQRQLELSLQDAHPDQRIPFLNRFTQFLEQEDRKVVQQNMERKAKFEALSAKNQQQLQAEYLERIKAEEEISKTKAELLQAHQTLSSELIGRFRKSITVNPDSNVVKSLEKNLHQEFNEAFKSIESAFETKLQDRETLSRTTIPEITDSFEQQGKRYVEANPVIKILDLDEKLENLIQDSTKQVQQKIDAAYPINSREGKQIMRLFLDKLEDLKMDIRDYKKSFQKKTSAAKEELVKECINFAELELRKVISRKTLENQSNLQKEFDDIRGLTEKMFQDSWSFGGNAEFKDSAWKEIVEQVEILENTARSNIKIKVEEEEKAIVDPEFIERLASKLSDPLTGGKIMSAEKFDSCLETIRKEAREAFSKLVTEKKPTNPVDVLHQLNGNLQAKFEELRQVNTNNTEVFRREAIRLSKSHMDQQKGSIKSQSQLERVARDAEMVGQQFLLEKCDDTSFVNELVQELLQLTKAYASRICQELCSSQNEQAVIDNAVKTYQEYMKNHVDGKKKIKREKLASHHKLATDASINGCMKTYFLSHKLETRIEKRLISTLEVYDRKLALEENQKKNVAIGIDLGTTTCCVAVYGDKGAKVIKNSQGHSLTPSYIHFPSDGTTPTVGNAAKDQAHIYPENTVFDSKRLIGREFRDPHVQNDIKIWPFEVKPSSSGRPEIIVNNTKYSPEDISARLLLHMKKIAEKELGAEVKKAVITVPANFDDRQRDATRQAARIAGLEVMNIINEPTAAAMAYAVNWKDEEKNVLVFDFGGGTLDVTILRACGADLTVLTTMGDTHLGGEDIDANMMEFCVKKFEDQHGIKLMEVNRSKAAQREENVKRRLRRLRGSCEDTKQNLTAAKKATVNVQAIFGETDLHVDITQEEFDKMNEELFKRSIEIVQEALRKTKLGKEDINEVLMVGGSSRIPRIQEMLKDFLGHRKLDVNQEVDIQEAVALGASIQACILNGGTSALNIILKDVQPFSLGISVKVGNRREMSVIIPKDSNIPVEKRESYTTTENNQEVVMIEIFSGEDLVPGKNKFLGSFALTGIPRGPPGSQDIDVLMQIDANGILNVTAVCISTGTSMTKTLEIQENRGRLTEEEIEQKRLHLEATHPSFLSRTLSAFGIK